MSPCPYTGCNYPEGECSGACASKQPAPIERALATQVGGGHYKDMPIQPAEFIHKNGLGFLEGCVIKRVCRWRKKDGVQDLRKAIHELELLIEMEMESAKTGEQSRVV